MVPPKIDLAAILQEQTAKKKKVVTPRPTHAKTQTASKSSSKPCVPKSTTSRAKDGGDEGRAQKEVSWKGVEYVDSLGSDMPRDDDSHPISPILINEEGDMLKDTNSIDANPRLAMSLLPVVALKKDLANVPKRLGDNLFHFLYHLMKVFFSLKRFLSFVLSSKLIAFISGSTPSPCM